MKSPAFQFYPADWLSSTDIQLMTPHEEGAYIRLLAHAWLQPDCGLPDDDEALAILSRLGRGWATSGKKIRAKFNIINDGRLYNPRQLLERQKQEEWAAKCSEGGKKSATKRQLKSKGSSTNLDVYLQVKPNSISSSSSIETTSSSVGTTTLQGETVDAVQTVTDWLEDYMAESGWGKPGFHIVEQILTLIDGAPLEQWGKFLCSLQDRKQRPDRGWQWFVTVTKDGFHGWRTANGV